MKFGAYLMFGTDSRRVEGGLTDEPEGLVRTDGTALGGAKGRGADGSASIRLIHYFPDISGFWRVFARIFFTREEEFFYSQNRGAGTPCRGQ